MSIQRFLTFLYSFVFSFCFFLPVAYGSLQTKPIYLRLSVGKAWSSHTKLDDKNCQQYSPKALFGCSHFARGDFSQSEIIELALGYRFNQLFRAEWMLNYQPSYRFSGQANFTSAGSNQPAHADASSLETMISGYFDFPSLSVNALNRIQPFVGVGLGLTKNTIGHVTYEFPMMATEGKLPITLVSGGNGKLQLSYLLTVGLRFHINKATGLELAYRFHDLGKVETRSGPAYIYGHGCANNAGESCVIPVGSTQAELKTHAVVVGFWHTL